MLGIENAPKSDIYIVSALALELEAHRERLKSYEELELTTEAAGEFLVGHRSTNPKAWMGKQRHYMSAIGKELMRAGFYC